MDALRRAWKSMGGVQRAPGGGFPACVARLHSCVRIFAADALDGRESVRVARSVRGAAEDCHRTAAEVRKIF